MSATFTVTEGEQVGFALRWAPPDDAAPERRRPPTSRARIDDIVEGWRSWEAEHDIYDGPHASSCAQRARPQGPDLPADGRHRRRADRVAARGRGRRAQLGLPLRLDPRREPDDEALYIGACSDEADEFVSFMTSSAGGRVDDNAADHVRHRRRARPVRARAGAPARLARQQPVRVGNGAWDQTQLDVYGELLNAITLYREQLGELHPEIQRFVADLADAAAARWMEQGRRHVGDARRARHHLSSKVLCWVALDRAVELAPHLGEHAKAERVGRRARQDPRGRARARLERAAPGLRAVLRLRRARRRAAADAARRLPARDDPRMRSTIDAIADELTEDGLCCATATSQG